MVLEQDNPATDSRYLTYSLLKRFDYGQDFGSIRSGRGGRISPTFATCWTMWSSYSTTSTRIVSLSLPTMARRSASTAYTAAPSAPFTRTSATSRGRLRPPAAAGRTRQKFHVRRRPTRHRTETSTKRWTRCATTFDLPDIGSDRDRVSANPLGGLRKRVIGWKQ